jgi:hypothetical protein
MAHEVDGLLFHFAKTKSTNSALSQKRQAGLAKPLCLGISGYIGDDLNVKGQVPFSQLIDSNPQKFTSTRLALQGAGARMPLRPAMSRPLFSNPIKPRSNR